MDIESRLDLLSNSDITSTNHTPSGWVIEGGKGFLWGGGGGGWVKLWGCCGWKEVRLSFN